MLNNEDLNAKELNKTLMRCLKLKKTLEYVSKGDKLYILQIVLAADLRDIIFTFNL